MKTFDKKDVYSWSNAEDAKKYIGKEGYFSNNFSALKIKVRNCDELTVLKNIDSYGICCFNTDEHFEGFGLFLPADKVKEVEESISFSINCTNSQLESYLEALNFVIGLATMICPKDELHLVSLAEELENILNKGLAK